MCRVHPSPSCRVPHAGELPGACAGEELRALPSRAPPHALELEVRRGSPQCGAPPHAYRLPWTGAPVNALSGVGVPLSDGRV